MLTFATELPADRESELREIRVEIGRLEAQLARLEAHEMTLRERLSRVEVELDLQRAKVNEAETALGWASERVDAAAMRITALQDQLERTRADVARRVTGLYRLGGQGYLRLFLAVDPDQDLLPALRQLRFLVRRDQRDIERYQRIHTDLERERETLAAEQGEAREWQQAQVERRDSLRSLERRHRRVLERAREEQRELEARAEILREKERKLAHLIDSLLRSSRGALDGVSIYGFRGVLDWPIQGEVTAEFGPRKDARYRTEVPHNGIEIAVPLDTGEVRSVYPGMVLFADIFEGYGKTVVVHHPGRVFTLYTGLDDLGVAKGDTLELGGLLGTVGVELYFEIREENQPVDPRGWLR